MEICTYTRTAYLTPGKGNPRNSEGAFLSLRDGRILFAYSRYHAESADDHADCEIAGIYSTDGGRTWDTEHIHTLVRAEEYGEKNVMSVSLARMDNGDAAVIFLLKHRETLTSECILRRSRDEFASFSGEARILPDRFPAYYVVNNDRICRVGPGHWVLPVAKHPTSFGKAADGNIHYDGRADACFFASTDDGFTWHQMQPLLFLPEAAYTGTGLQEPGMCVLPGGVWYAYFRTDRMYQYETVSIDRGAHWFTPQPSRFSSPASPLLIKQNPYSHKYYAIWNPTPEYPGRARTTQSWIGGRTPLVIAESEDGVGFSPMQILEDDPCRGFCYPGLYFTDAKTALLSYCSGGDDVGGCLNRTTLARITLA